MSRKVALVTGLDRCNFGVHLLSKDVQLAKEWRLPNLALLTMVADKTILTKGLHPCQFMYSRNIGVRQRLFVLVLVSQIYRH